MQEIYLALGQMLFGLVLACVGLFLFFVAPGAIIDWFVDRKVRLMFELPLYPFEIAELRSGGWQYYDDFFNKMEDFRNDISSK